MMKLENGKFYFIKDNYFKIVNDKSLLLNKDNGNKRPCYYCISDDNNKGIYWLIPISSKVDKYKKIYKYKLYKYGKVDTLVFGKVNNNLKAFLIQNMFPITEKYIAEKYVRNNTDVEITYTLKKEIDIKAKFILSLAERGKNVLFTDIIRIKKILLDEIKNNN